MRLLLFSLLIFLGISPLYAKVTISANQPEYANKKLEFYVHDDPVTLSKVTVFELIFDKQGTASVTIDINETTCYYCDFGIYRGILFVEPAGNISLKIPPLREKSFADDKNPFFEPVKFWFNTNEPDNINNQISTFTLQLNRYTDEHFDQLYFHQSKAVYDSLLLIIDKNFSGLTSPTFKTYKNLSLKLLLADVFRLTPENYASEISSISSSQWQNPAFEDLLVKAFNSQLSSTAKSVNGTDIKKAIGNSDLNFLTNWVQYHFNISGETAQLALLKLLYDGYYSGDFSKSSIEKMIQSSYFANAKNKLISKTAINIYSKFTFLKVGTAAPEICLDDLKGTENCTLKNNGKYKYLLFVDLEMAVCREHLKYLSAIDEQFQKYLEIYVIFRDIDITEINKFIAENPVPGKLLIDKNGEYISGYNIKTFPQCFLLNENHNVKLESAKSPLDGFEQQFSTLLRNDFIEKQRNQSR